MRYLALAIALCVGLGGMANAQERITEGQAGLMDDLLLDDLATYLEGGSSVFSDDWSRMATPWTTDQAIGVRYSHGTVAADNFYTDRTVFVRGHYLSASNWIGDSYRVQMALVAAIVDKSESAFLQDATNGSIVSMACHAAGKEMEFVYLDGCRAQKFAMADLIRREAATITSRQSPADLNLMHAAAAFNKKIPADDPCRATMGGCIDLMRSALR